MTIKEIEKLLEIPRATVRFYEKEGLISPARGGNSYREYSEEDVATLKKIIIFRKLGMSVEDIRSFLEGDTPLQELLTKNITELQEQMKELEGAIHVCKMMQAKNEDKDTFDQEFYWDEIRTEERAGSKFLELVNDVISFEKNIIFKEFELINDQGEFLYSKKEAVLRALGSCLMIGVLWCALDGWKVKSFVEGFFWPFMCIFIYSVFGLPIYFIGKKHPKAAKVLTMIGWGLAALLVLALVLLIIFGKAE